MNATQPIVIPERLRVVVTLAQLLQRLESSPRQIGADQYLSVVRHLSVALDSYPADAELDAVLGLFPAAATVYENLRYEQAGLCRSPLDASLEAELQARSAIARAAGKPSR